MNKQSQQNQPSVSAGGQMERTGARELRNRYKLIYSGSRSRQNGVGVILDPELKW